MNKYTPDEHKNGNEGAYIKSAELTELVGSYETHIISIREFN